MEHRSTMKSLCSNKGEIDANWHILGGIFLSTRDARLCNYIIQNICNKSN